MNNINPFEKEIKQTYRLPDANPAFFNRLEAKLQAYQHNPEAKAKPTFHFVRGWVYAAATLIFLGALVLPSVLSPGADTSCFRICAKCRACGHQLTLQATG